LDPTAIKAGWQAEVEQKLVKGGFAPDLAALLADTVSRLDLLPQTEPAQIRCTGWLNLVYGALWVAGGATIGLITRDLVDMVLMHMAAGAVILFGAERFVSGVTQLRHAARRRSAPGLTDAASS
jgi:hypothetical protein